MSKSLIEKNRIESLINNNFNPEYLKIEIGSYISFPSLESKNSLFGPSLTEQRMNYLLEEYKQEYTDCIKNFITPIAKQFKHYKFKVKISIIYEFYNFFVGHSHPIMRQENNKKGFLDFKIYISDGNRIFPLGILNDDSKLNRLYQLEYSDENNIQPTIMKKQNNIDLKLTFNVNHANPYYKIKTLKHMRCTNHCVEIFNFIKKLKSQKLIHQYDRFQVSYTYEKNYFYFRITHDNFMKQKLHRSRNYSIGENNIRQLLSIFNEEEFIFTSDWFDQDVEALPLENILELACILKY